MCLDCEPLHRWAYSWFSFRGHPPQSYWVSSSQQSKNKTSLIRFMCMTPPSRTTCIWIALAWDKTLKAALENVSFPSVHWCLGGCCHQLQVFQLAHRMRHTHTHTHLSHTGYCHRGSILVQSLVTERQVVIRAQRPELPQKNWEVSQKAAAT